MGVLIHTVAHAANREVQRSAMSEESMSPQHRAAHGSALMKAVVCNRYGPPEVLELQEIAKPVPAENEILVKVHATTVSAADFRARSSTFPSAVWLPARIASGVRKPSKAVLGAELSGEVEAVGAGVKRFSVGDQVFAATLVGYGAYAEYKCVAEDGPVALKPRNVTFEEAAAIPVGARTALYYLRAADVQRGQKVLVYGASGSVGTYAVQLAKYFGAHVTAVCSTANLELARSLGADRTIDYTAGDFALSGTYDVIFDTVDSCPFAACVESLTRAGIYLNCTSPIPSLRMLYTRWTGARRWMLGQGQPETAAALTFLAALVEAGKIRVVVDRRYTLEQIVEAHRYVDTGRKKGNVVVSVSRRNHP
jgi:NADPH:quinone reductase-like Zn-dependent oxidoreductase